MQAWEKFLKLQEIELGKETVDKWLRTLSVIHFDACNLYLEAKDAFQVMWFEEHIRKKIQKQLLNNNGKRIQVQISYPNAPSKKTKPPHSREQKDSEEFKISFDELNPYCTFNSFISAECNLLVYKLLSKITNFDPVSGQIIPSPTYLASFNPVYLYGGEGTGKTHLLMATAHALKSHDLNVVYCRADTFTEHVVTAIRSGQMATFRQAYRNVDVLIIDDVHLFSRKAATQEELFHTFNTLHLGGKQIILSSNCSPAELQYIEPRLVSRFEWGIVLPLEPMPEEEIPNILTKKAQALDFKLHPKVKEFLISTFTKSTKTLNGALEALLLRHHLKLEKDKRPPTPITVQIAKHLLKDLIENEEKSILSPEKIVQIVAEYFGITVRDITGKAQNRVCTVPRQLAMYFCRSKLKLPYTKIGQIFTRDHSTVMSSIKQVQASVDQNDNEIVGAHRWIQKKLTL